MEQKHWEKSGQNEHKSSFRQRSRELCWSPVLVGGSGETQKNIILKFNPWEIGQTHFRSVSHLGLKKA